MAIWRIWAYLGFAYRLFFLILTGIATYSVITDLAVLLRLRSLARQSQIDVRLFTRFRARMSNVLQLLLSAFYLFAFIFFLFLPHAGDEIGESRLTGGQFIWVHLSVDFAAAAKVFFVLLVLHLLSWFVSARVNAAAARLEIAPPANL